MFIKCFGFILFFGLLAQSGFSQPENMDELPKEIQKYLELNFKGYKFSNLLSENVRRTQKNELTEKFLNLPVQSHYYLEGDFNSDEKQDYLLNLY